MQRGGRWGKVSGWGWGGAERWGSDRLPFFLLNLPFEGRKRRRLSHCAASFPWVSPLCQTCLCPETLCVHAHSAAPSLAFPLCPHVVAHCNLPSSPSSVPRCVFDRYDDVHFLEFNEHYKERFRCAWNRVPDMCTATLCTARFARQRRHVRKA